MKPFSCLLLLAVLFGCSSNMVYQSNIELQPAAPAAAVYTDSSAVLHGQDRRVKPAVVIYNSDSAPPVELENSMPMHKLITGRLAESFQQQGLKLEADAPVTMSLEILTLQGVVTRPKALYKTDVHSHIQFVVNNRGTRLTKDYTREADRESLTRPDLQDVESMLEEQLAEILELILDDAQVQELIRKRD